ncbi:MAG: signal peptidase I [Burkholderiaceae bacterium]|jgi:signal peptidase I|nr:signal peptidase I [Gemmatimonadales bacterium]MCO5118324.1 signal peptidase I [Burkholderiaceae bacterium]
MNFALILFLLLVVSFAAWIADRLRFRPARLRAAAAALEAFDAQGAPQVRAKEGEEGLRAERRRIHENAMRQPWWLEYTAGLFPVILIVFVVRSFVAEPFKIPSGSMMPTLLTGDLILVNKSTYGIRLPIVHTKVVPLGLPERGDVMVFRYPLDTSIDYIKRVVGLPGDEIEYFNRRLRVNGEEVPLAPDGEFFDAESLSFGSQYLETLGERPHKILTNLEKTSSITPQSFTRFRDRCTYNSEGVRCTVPDGHYFVMGDNRENSLDSRFWGFVPEENIVGRAFFIWMNFGDLKRIGTFE